MSAVEAGSLMALLQECEGMRVHPLALALGGG
jgi:hypothetical protein